MQWAQPAAQQLLQWRHLKLLPDPVANELCHCLQIASEEFESQHTLRSAAERKADDLEAALSAASSAARAASEV